MSELVGYSLKELCMLGVADIHLKEDLPYVVDEFTKLSEGKKVLASDIPVLRKDGKVGYCDVTSAVSRFGKNECLVGFFRDISERKSAVETLESRERRYREFAESLPEIVFEADDKCMPTFLNKKAFEIMGYSNDEIKQMNILQFLVLEDRQRAKENLQRRMHGEKTVGNEYTLLRKDGATFPGIIFTEKIVTQEGTSSGVRGVIVDISQTKKVTEELKCLMRSCVWLAV
jgi:PAS domain S-box-containing protein